MSSLTTSIKSVTILFASAWLFACSSHASIKPFTTDGCSLFPDRSLITGKDWCNCCLIHDLAYWRGGTAAERATADKALETCVEQATGNKALAELMFTGVRTGGGPYYFTSYRWGYGWPYGREYKSLSAEESAAANRLENEFRSSHPILTCEKTVATKP